MSRIGKKPIDIPAGVKVAINSNEVAVQGPKGSLKLLLTGGIQAKVENNVLTLLRANEERQTVAKHGLYRALVMNMVNGVTNTFVKELEIIGVGYKAEVSGKKVIFNLGFTNPVDFPIPEGIEVKIDAKKNIVTVSGANKELVGEVACQMRRLRPPEPYKGKGVKYVSETIHRKVGKAAVGATS